METGLTLEDFEPFFRAVMKRVTGEEVAPYPWQKRLVETVFRDGWPEAIDLPTGSGKTSVLAIAVFLLALEAGRPPAERKTGLRIIYTVDRRLIVDQAEKFSEALKSVIDRADEKKDDVPGRVRRALLSYGGEGALDVLKLRGGLYGRLPWVREPNRPTIILTTVDQIGSRLLFRGYGTGRRQWPVHAALSAIDAIYFLDEVHLSWPFAETLSHVRRLLSFEPLVGNELPPLRRVIMSGTIPKGLEAGSVFRLDESDRNHPGLKRRLEARRFVQVVEKSLAPSSEQRETEQIAEWLAEEAAGLREGAGGPIAIIANRVATARAVFERFKDEAVLLTGRVRPYDRRRIIERLFSSPVVVATQTIEVGVDVSFAGMVTEAAPCDALVQRLGRLNRDGRFDDRNPTAIIIVPKGKDYRPYPYEAGDVEACVRALRELRSFGKATKF